MRILLAVLIFFITTNTGFAESDKNKLQEQSDACRYSQKSQGQMAGSFNVNAGHILSNLMGEDYQKPAKHFKGTDKSVQ